MSTRQRLGDTNLELFPIAFGAGPISGLMTAEDSLETRRRQFQVVETAVQLGVNWFDTAAGYGEGRSEIALGRALTALGTNSKIHVATKVRLSTADLENPKAAIEKSVRGSLERLGIARVALVQLHNSVTRSRGDLPTSVSVEEVVRPDGILDALDRVQEMGLTEHIGLTGLGQLDAIETVVQTGRLKTIQLPVNALLMAYPLIRESSVGELPIQRIIPLCQRFGMGIFAIRVLAGGALAKAPPSEYTRVSRFFTLESYQRDAARAVAFAGLLPAGGTLPEFAVRSALSYPGVTAAIVGFGAPEEVREAVEATRAGRFSSDWMRSRGLIPP